MGKPQLPKNEGPKVSISTRYPQKIIDRVKAIAEATGNTEAEVYINFVRWACDEWEAEEAKERAAREGTVERRGIPRRKTDKPESVEKTLARRSEKASGS